MQGTLKETRTPCCENHYTKWKPPFCTVVTIVVKWFSWHQNCSHTVSCHTFKWRALCICWFLFSSFSSWQVQHSSSDKFTINHIYAYRKEKKLYTELMIKLDPKPARSYVQQTSLTVLRSQSVFAWLSAWWITSWGWLKTEQQLKSYIHLKFPVK